MRHLSQKQLDKLAERKANAIALGIKLSRYNDKKFRFTAELEGDVFIRIRKCKGLESYHYQLKVKGQVVKSTYFTAEHLVDEVKSVVALVGEDEYRTTLDCQHHRYHPLRAVLVKLFD